MTLKIGLESYTIRELEKLTGIKAHTIRAWEKRYGLLNPTRNPANRRSYLKKDLELLKCIAVLKKDGIKISRIAEMSKDEIDHQAICCCERKMLTCDHPEIIRRAIIKLKPQMISDWIDKKFVEKGVVQAMLQEVFPLKNKVHVMKLTGEINNIQEEFVEQLILRKLATQIERAETTHHGTKEAILYVPQGNRSELCLLFSQLLLTEQGYNVINVGKIERIQEIKQLIQQRKPHLVMTFLSEKFCRCSVKEYITHLAKLSVDTRIIISGYQVKNIHFETPAHVSIYNNLKEIAQNIIKLY